MRRFVAAVCVALTLAGVLAVLPVADAGALAPHRVSMTPSKVEVDLPNSIRLNGSVPTASPGKGIVIDQLFGTVWRPVTLGRTDGGRRYSLVFAPRTPGYVKLRARVTGDRSHAAAVSPASTVAVYRWRRLVNEPVVFSDENPIRGEVLIDGTSYGNTLSFTSYDDGDRIDFNLRRKCVELRAVIGLRDDNLPDTTSRVQVVADGNVLFSRQFALGSSVAARLNTRGWLRLRLVAVGGQATSVRFGPVVSFGEARIRCLF